MPDSFSTARIVGAYVLVLFLVVSCKPAPKALTGRLYTGVFLATPYTIDVVGDSTDYQREIDSLLAGIAGAFDLGDSTSVLSRYNRFQRTDTAFCFIDRSGAFGAVFGLAKDLNRQTLRFYDPTTNPIRRAWMSYQWKDGRVEPNLDSLYEFVTFDARVDLNEVTTDGYTYRESQLRKADPRTELDFTSLATAYAMDRVAAFFNEKGIPQYHLTFGNRHLTQGALVDSLNIVPLGVWGDANDQQIRVQNSAYAFKTIRDKAGMIDVNYGYPVENEIAFVAVSAPTAAEAEVFSEAFMIMGVDQASAWYEANETTRIQSFMLIQRENEMTTASTEGFDALFIVPDSLATE